MLTRSLKVGLAVFLAAALTAHSSATIWLLSAFPSGIQEVPPNASPASGTLIGTLNDVTGAISVSGTYSILLAPITAAHIHGLAPAGVNAGVILPLVTTGGTSGSYTGNGVFTPAQVNGVIAGLTYANFHTSQFPGGEIRGQISAVVPEPSTMLALGVGAAAFLRRRKSR